jgi:YEATS domain-containing protein 4
LAEAAISTTVGLASNRINRQTNMSSQAILSVPGKAQHDLNNKETQQRLEKTTACLPIVYGSVAFFLGKKADEFKTHQWTLYVRGPNNEDLSGIIDKVVFQLHASFAEPMREILQPPFEVTECGWGEFEAQIRIVWAKEAREKDIVVSE